MLYCATILCLFLFEVKSKEYYSSITHLERLKEVEEAVKMQLNAFIKEQETYLDVLKSTLANYQEDISRMKNNHDYLKNPFNAFITIKRLSFDIKTIDEEITKIRIAAGLRFDQLKLDYPTHDDVVGAVTALVRLSHTYNLSMMQLSQLKLMKQQYRHLTAEDYYLMGETLYEEKQYLDSALVFENALQKYRKTNDSFFLPEAELLKMTETSFVAAGLFSDAKKYVLELLASDPDNNHYQERLKHYEEELSKTLVSNVSNSGPATYNEIPWVSRFQMLCRGDCVELHPSVTKSYHCKYINNGNPFLMIAPFKQELVYHDPEILIYHDVISDDEIKFLQDVSRNRLERAMVKNFETFGSVTSPARTSKSAWISDSFHPRIKKLTKRIEDVTGYSLSTAESFQVGNYGMGGHYGVHVDYLEKRGYKLNHGDRIATFMFYLSDVEAGGATVFTALGVSIKPQKGAGIVWRNLHKSTKNDSRTEHGACPVLFGDKWVANKWIRQNGQELVSPCALIEDNFETATPPPQPIILEDKWNNPYSE